jgi:hypothetical protein
VIKKMVSCKECGKELGVFEGYRHPVMGKKHHLCSPCFDQVSESVARWKEFVMSNSFNVNAVSGNTSVDWKQFASNFTQMHTVNENLMPVKVDFVQK